MYVGTKKYSLSREKEILRMYPEKFNCNFKILIGTKDILQDLQDGYKKVFQKAIDKYNKNSIKKIENYYLQINESKKLSLATGIVIKISEETLSEHINDNKILTLFKNQIKSIKKELPTFHIVNAILYFEEALILRVVGITYKKDEENDLETRVLKSECFNKNSMEFLRETLKMQAKSDYLKFFINKLDMKRYIAGKEINESIQVTQLSLFSNNENSMVNRRND